MFYAMSCLTIDHFKTYTPIQTHPILNHEVMVVVDDRLLRRSICGADHHNVYNIIGFLQRLDKHAERNRCSMGPVRAEEELGLSLHSSEGSGAKQLPQGTAHQLLTCLSNLLPVDLTMQMLAGLSLSE